MVSFERADGAPDAAARAGILAQLKPQSTSRFPSKWSVVPHVPCSGGGDDDCRLRCSRVTYRAAHAAAACASTAFAAAELAVWLPAAGGQRWPPQSCWAPPTPSTPAPSTLSSRCEPSAATQRPRFPCLQLPMREVVRLTGLPNRLGSVLYLFSVLSPSCPSGCNTAPVALLGSS